MIVVLSDNGHSIDVDNFTLFFDTDKNGAYNIKLESSRKHKVWLIFRTWDKFRAATYDLFHGVEHDEETTIKCDGHTYRTPR